MSAPSTVKPGSEILLRTATQADAALLVEFIRKLAEYEREPNTVSITEQDILRDGFGPEPKFWALIAECDGQAAAYAFYFFLYSSWFGKQALYLEDLFVLEEFRRRGIGTALMRELARVALARDCYALTWEVLEWNQPALETYKAWGAEMLSEWRLMRLPAEAARKLLGRSS